MDATNHGSDLTGGTHPDLPRIPRRRFLGYLVAGPTLVAGAQLGLELIHDKAHASVKTGSVVPSPAEPSDVYDLTDALTDATMPTANLIRIVISPDGKASFALPRAEVGQGITTAVAMTIADELDIALSDVVVTLADARPELVWNQFTGGSNSMHSVFTPVRVAAAVAKGQLLQAAAIELGATVDSLTASSGIITAPSGRSVTYGSLAVAAAVPTTTAIPVELKNASDFTVVGTPRRRVDALDIVTGRKQFTMDLDVPGALPTMVCRPPTINGTVVAVKNSAQVLAMPGITDVAVVPTGVAVRGQTFGQCIDAVDALEIVWGPGTEDSKSDSTVLAELKSAELPLAPTLPPGASTVDRSFTFYFVSNTPLETNCAIADVRPGRAEIWSSLKSPIRAQETIAQDLGLPVADVVCHVTQGGGSFGRHLFLDAALEAARISQKMGKPVKLMWHRTDDFRQGRMHPMATSRVRASHIAGNVVTFEQRHTSVRTDFSHGLGEILSGQFGENALGAVGLSQTVFGLTQSVPYNFGTTDQLLNEVDSGFNTGSCRNIYSPDVTTATELIVDQLAAQMGSDPLRFRQRFLKDGRLLAVLDKVATVGNWGRPMTSGTAQGLGLHSEYKSRAAALVEIDSTPATVNRRIINGVGGPRVTKVVLAVDAGLPINPLGLQAQMMGGVMDGIARALTFSVHIQNGVCLEGSWDHSYYTRQWNVPFELEIIVMPPTTGVPGGAGELGVAPTMAAVACAYARATGALPTSFPINHNLPLGFTPFPTEPPVPESPVNPLP